MLVAYEGSTPRLGKNVFVAQTATVLGRVTLGDEASVWYGCVVRGDVGTITIGARTNIQDLTVIHVTTNKFDTRLGDDVVVGHRVVLHGCTIGNRVLVGMGAIVMDGAEIGDGSLIGAGALVTPGTKVPPGSLVLGSPAKVVRALTEKERQGITENAAHYVELAAKHAAL
jgi:carbonic anhydrase/acetyltransferase-like protein (isoleucine patch superfamily)